jgi:hypothetical protein
MAAVTGRMDTRYSFTSQFLMAAILQTQEAYAIEQKPVDEVSETDRVRHRGYVVGAIMQSVAALEAEIWEVMVYGPGHHLGSNGIDAGARDFLCPVAELIDRQDALSRYATVLHLLKKKPIDFGTRIPQNASMVVKLRNEIVHYKSKLGVDLDRVKLFRALQKKGHRRPPFQQGSGMNFFPHFCLSADCAAWAAQSCIRFINQFYEFLEISSPLSAYSSRLDLKRPLPS